MIPYLQVRSKSIIYYSQPEYSIRKAHSVINSVAKQNAVQTMKEAAKYTGMITVGSKKRLTKAISMLIQCAPTKWEEHPVTKQYFHHKLSFITLTLPNIDQCKDAKFTHKQLLEPMLRVLRRRYQMKMYVWKCELQKNGTVHYHITSDILISYSKLQEEWNNILRSKDLLLAYKQKYKHDNPHSTDIHEVRAIRDLEAYLVKYVAKESQNEKSINAKIWDCSGNLKAAKYFVTQYDGFYDQQLRSLEQLGICQSYSADRYAIYKFKNSHAYEYLSPTDRGLYKSHLKSIVSWEKSSTLSTPISSLKHQTTSASMEQLMDHSLPSNKHLSSTTLLRTLADWKALGKGSNCTSNCYTQLEFEHPSFYRILMAGKSRPLPAHAPR